MADEHQPKTRPAGRAVKADVAGCIARARAGGPYYTRCNPAALPLQQATCNLPSQRTQCVTNFRCRELGKGAAHGGGGGGGGGKKRRKQLLKG